MFAHSKVGIVNVFLDSLSRARRHKSCPVAGRKRVKTLMQIRVQTQEVRSQLEGAAAFCAPRRIFIHRTPASEFPLQLARLAEILARVEKLKSSPRVKQSDVKEAFARKRIPPTNALMAPPKCTLV
jgi:hypothetical protein